MLLCNILVVLVHFVVCVHSFVALRPNGVTMVIPTTLVRRMESSYNSKSLRNLQVDHSFTEYDKYGTERQMQWDPVSRLFLPVQQEVEDATSSSFKFAPFLLSSFIPTGDLSPDYYRFSAWRVIQRLIGSTNNVFGTQALLLALGLKKDKIGLAAASSWVLKDALGKISRIVFASKYGRRFDVDTKKWRFRASLLYSTGTALEILTFLFPSCFIVSAAIATAFKQMAMLSNSSTRNAIYKSFSRNADNIGDITAKGEAQIAVIDIFGLALGITIAKVMNQSRWRVIAAFVLLSALDFLAVYREIRSVVFSTLNYERANLVLRELIPLLPDAPAAYTHPSTSTSASPAPALTAPAASSPDAAQSAVSSGVAAEADMVAGSGLKGGKRGRVRKFFSAIKNSLPPLPFSRKKGLAASSLSATAQILSTTPNPSSPAAIAAPSPTSPPAAPSVSPALRERMASLTPPLVAQREELLLPSQPGESVFSTFSMLLGERKKEGKDVFATGNPTLASPTLPGLAADPLLSLSFSLSEKYHKKFLFTFSLRPLSVRDWAGRGTGSLEGDRKVIRTKDGSHAFLFTPRILLHKDASHTDIFQAWVVLTKVMCELQEGCVAVEGEASSDEEGSAGNEPTAKDSDSALSSLAPILQRAYAFEHHHYGTLLRLLEEGGWETKRWAFGSQKIRVKW